MMRQISSLLIFAISFFTVTWLATGLIGKVYSQNSNVPTPETRPATSPASPGASGVNQAGSSATQNPDVQSFGITQTPAADNFNYDPTGRRDPFRPYGTEIEKSQIPGGGVIEMGGMNTGEVTELQNFEIMQLKLVAVSWGTRRPIAVVRDPTGKHHVVKKYTKIGRGSGFVAVIREGEVVIIEPAVIDGNATAVTKVLVLNK